MPQARAAPVRTTARTVPGSSSARLLAGGAAAGITAGTVLLFYTVAVWIWMGQRIDQPARIIASTFSPSWAYARSSAGPIALGLVVHFALSIGFGVFFAALVGPKRPSVAAAWGVPYGLTIALLMRLLVLPELNPLLALTPGWPFLAGHAVFGALLGLAPRFGRVRPPVRLSAVPSPPSSIPPSPGRGRAA